MNRTPYAETEFLLAVMDKDEGEIERIVSDMLPGEVKALHKTLGEARTELEMRGA